MKIIQLLTNLNWGDAIGNDVLAIDDTLRSAGYDCSIMAFTINEKLADRAENVDLSSIGPEDVVLFHKATGDILTNRIAELPCRKGMIYHNITPAHFFLPYDAVMAWNLDRGRRQLKKYAGQMDFAWGDSEFNCRELRKAGAKNVSVRPVFFNTSSAEADPEIQQKLRDEKGTKILFIGRIAPNKKYENIIKAYHHFINLKDGDAKLYLVGSWEGLEKYYAKLKGFAADLNLSDKQVVFTGRVSEEEKAAYLEGSDVLLCMSEHEGFCVPVLEAAEHDLPVVAYTKGAVPDTLGDNGLLVYKKDYEAIANIIDKVCSNMNFRNEVINKQKTNAERFDRKKTEKRVIDLIREAGA